MVQLWTMSDQELSRYEVLQRVTDRRMTQQQAGQILGLTRRQIYRLLQAVQHQGAAGLVSKRRGKRGNRQLAPGLATEAVTIIQQRYADFGPTLACEKLRELHGITLSVEVVRKLMVQARLWTPRALRGRQVHQPRIRRQCLGELIQIDGCDHHWFEDRAPRCTMLVYVDDATSRIMEARFVETESTLTYMESTKDYIMRHGKPLAFYSDRHSVFSVNQQEHVGYEGITQFYRSLQQLGIELICATSPQAKGRVERAHQTLQDRLVKEMRLQGVSSIAAGNAFLATYLPDYNRRFAIPPSNPLDLHRPPGQREKLDDIFTIHEKRLLTGNLTFRYNNTVYCIEPCAENLKLRNRDVTVMLQYDGSIRVRHGRTELKFVKDYTRVSRTAPPKRAHHKDLTAIMQKLLPEQDRFIDLSINNGVRSAHALSFKPPSAPSGGRQNRQR